MYNIYRHITLISPTRPMDVYSCVRHEIFSLTTFLTTSPPLDVALLTFLAFLLTPKL